MIFFQKLTENKENKEKLKEYCLNQTKEFYIFTKNDDVLLKQAQKQDIFDFFVTYTWFIFHLSADFTFGAETRDFRFKVLILFLFWETLRLASIES